MNLNPKLAIIAIVAFALLSGIGGYFAREYKAQLVTETQAHEQTQSKLDIAEAFITMKEAQLKRAYSMRTVSKPVLLNGKIAYEKTSETISNEESKTIEFSEMIQKLTQDNATLSDKLDRLSKIESSRGGVKKWGLIGKYNFPHWEAGLGFRQDLGLIDVGLYGLTSVPTLSTHSVAVSVGF